MEHSPDGKAYLVAHGAAVPDPQPRFANHSWITGDSLYLIRVTPQHREHQRRLEIRVLRRTRRLRQADLERRFPQDQAARRVEQQHGLRDDDLQRAVEEVFDVRDRRHATPWAIFNTYLLESDQITGPWKLVTYMKHFGEQAYFVNIPSKFIAADGRTLWLCYSANFCAGQQQRAFPQSARRAAAMRCASRK